ncbi:RHS repeat-associated core domain-containing protein [Pseudomonas sp. Hz4]
MTGSRQVRSFDVSANDNNGRLLRGVASLHHHTPTLFVNDSRGLPVRQVDYLREVDGGAVEGLVNRQLHDAAGRLAEQWDPRLFASAPKPNLATVYGLGGVPLKVDSVDAGWRLSLPGPAGEALQRWDQRGSHWRTTYDPQLRPIAIEENGQPNVETFIYADASADPAHNLRGQLTEQLDRSGTLWLDSYSLLGQPLRETRTLEGEPYRSSRIYSPLGTVLSQTDVGDHLQQLRYDIAGQLKQVQLRIKGSLNWQPVLKHAQYNATGQITEQRAGNDVFSTWTYDPADGRLSTQRAQKTAEPALQNFEYFYDRVGNITRILDHVFTPTFFANQRVDGHREFTYDSLYRLHTASGYDDAPPSDVPGLPQPTDPNDRRNYTQTYRYDHGGNLIELRHAREGANHTRQMVIDPVSNRGVRWTEGDPDPQFDRLFDPHGNLQALQPGQGMQWNARDQLASVTLIDRGGSDPDDAEHYRYSQGARVFKRQETHTSATSHFHEVRYLPGLEIRTRDNGEELHVITLAGGFGSARCLHWVTGKPAGIDNDQLRYTLDDHLGSCVMELDQQAQMISHEGYYPFGATAWMAVRSQIEVAYTFIRYSGKEMDVSGLYFYGARYYAPWLQRWISADPAGDVDGLNLYVFVGNNPLSYVDHQGGIRVPFAIPEQIKASFANGDPRGTFDLKIWRHLELLDAISLGVRDTEQQVLNHRSAAEHGKSAAHRTGFFLAGQGVSIAASMGVGALLGTPAGPPGMVIGAAVGLATGKVVSLATEYVGKKSGMSSSVSLQSNLLNPTKVLAKINSESSDRYLADKASKWLPTNKEGRENLAKEAATFGLKKVPYAGTALGTVFKVKDIFQEVNDGGKDLSEDQFNALDSNIISLIETVERGTTRLLNMAKEYNRQEVLGYNMERIGEKSKKRVNILNDLRTVLYSKSKKFTAV